MKGVTREIMVKKLLCILCIICISLTGFNAFAEDSDTIVDEYFVRAEGLLKGISILSTDTDKRETSFITRAEFADILAKFINMANTESAGDLQLSGDKYLGFTNDEIEEDDWLWIDEQGKTETNSALATPYYDVSKDNKYWNAINMVSQYGLMSGYDGHFRPDERITYNEVIKVMTCVVGAEMIVPNHVYPDTYISTARDLDILKKLSGISYYDFITYRDLAVVLFNTLHSDIYVLDGSLKGGFPSYSKSSEVYMEKVFDLYEAKGIITANEITSLKAGDEAPLGYFMLDDEEYLCGNVTIGENIGQQAVVYYHMGEDENEAKYAYLTSANKTLTVDAEDIVDFSDTTLKFDVGNRTKKEYIGTQQSIIYNGKALTNYNDTDLEIKEGNITFIDNNNDGDYEVVIVESVELMWVSAVDIDRKIIYDKLDKTDKGRVDLSHDEYEITDSMGESVGISGITERAVISVKRTLDGQAPYCRIIISDASVSGKITKYDEDYIYIDDVMYKRGYTISATDLGSFNARFYLDENNKIVTFTKENELEIGFVVKAHEGEDFDEVYIKLYTLDDTFERYQLADKIKFNDIGRITKTRFLEIYNEKTEQEKHEFITYKRNAEGKITEITYAETDPEVETEGLRVMFDETLLPRSPRHPYLHPSGDYINLVCRVDGNKRAFLKDRPVYYGDSTLYWINIPESDFGNEDNYFRKTYAHDEYVNSHRIYSMGSDTRYASMMIYYSDSSSIETVSAAAPALMVKKIKTIYDEKTEEIVREITMVGHNGRTIGEQTLICSNERQFSKIDELQRGDLFSYSLDSKTGNIKAVEKLFDAGDQRMVGDNPSTTGNTGEYLSNRHLMHSIVIRKTDDGEFMDVSPYKYSSSDGKTYDPDDIYSLPTTLYTVYVYDSESGTVERGSAANILDLESAGSISASKIVSYAFWATPRILYIYK